METAVETVDISVNERLERINRIDQNKPRRRVVVIGAGMAGLAAAFELKRLGHDVSIIEASGRVGGRVWTHYFKATGEYHELGAMRIPEKHDYTRHYIRLTGLDKDLRPFITAHKQLNCFYHLRGKVSRISDARRTIFPLFNLSAQERALAEAAVAPALFGVHLENALSSLNHEDRQSLFGQRFLTDRAAELESQTLGEFLERRVESDDAKELIGVTTGLEVWWDKAVTMFLRDEIVGTGNGLEEISGGMSRLPEGLADALGRDVIRFNTEVCSIELLANGVQLRLRPTDPSVWDSPPKEAEPVVEVADFVLCTIPFGVLRRMDISGLSALKMRAIRNLNYASSTKVLLHCKERFWERGGPNERIIGGASLSDQITRSTYYPSDHATAPASTFGEVTQREGFRGLFTDFTLDDTKPKPVSSPGPGVLVGSYNWGRDARRLGSLPTGERAEAVMDVLANFHKEIREYVDDTASMFWDTYRWSRGAFCFMAPGDLRNYYHAAVRPEGRLHFAGEHCSLDQGWIQGAVMSGLRAVEEIVTV